MNSDDIRRMDIAEFREVGFLQEANRQFFHPLGLALEVTISECGACGSHQHETCTNCGGTGRIERLSGVWDYRDDPEGIVVSGPPDADKAARVAAERARHADHRAARFGWVIQPVGRGIEESGHDG